MNIVSPVTTNNPTSAESACTTTMVLVRPRSAPHVLIGHVQIRVDTLSYCAPMVWHRNPHKPGRFVSTLPRKYPR